MQRQRKCVWLLPAARLEFHSQMSLSPLKLEFYLASLKFLSTLEIYLHGLKFYSHARSIFLGLKFYSQSVCRSPNGAARNFVRERELS